MYNEDSGYVDTEIQAVIDHEDTDTGHTILVGPGTYEENVEVNVPGLTLIGQDGAEIESQEPGEHEDSEPAVFITADNVTIDNIDLVEGISPGDGQEVALIDSGVSGTTLANLEALSPDFVGEAGHGQPLIGSDGAVGDTTIENVVAERTIGLQIQVNSEVVVVNVEVTKAADNAEAIWITGPNWGDAVIDLTIEDFTPLQNDEGTGSDSDVKVHGQESEVNDVDGTAEDLADAIFVGNPDVDQVEIDGDIFTRE